MDETSTAEPNEAEPNDAGELLASTELTVVRPEATRRDLDRAASRAAESGYAALCVQPEHVAFVADLLDGRTPVTAMVGFPHGATLARLKAAEAAAVVAHGAQEVEVVVALGPIAEHDLDHVAHEVAAVREAVPGVVVRAVLESALWAPAVLRDAAEAALRGGADVLVTSTGVHPSGGATVAAVEVLCTVAGTRARVKAAGRIDDDTAARRLLAAGADRIAVPVPDRW